MGPGTCPQLPPTTWLADLSLIVVMIFARPPDLFPDCRLDCGSSAPVGGPVPGLSVMGPGPVRGPVPDCGAVSEGDPIVFTPSPNRDEGLSPEVQPRDIRQNLKRNFEHVCIALCLL